MLLSLTQRATGGNVITRRRASRHGLLTDAGKPLAPLPRATDIGAGG
jgi:hypothetical protein